MSKLMKSRIRLFAVLVVIFTLIGMVDAYFGSIYFESAGRWEAMGAALRNGLNWMVGSALVWGLEIFLVPSRYGVAIRRMYFLNAIAVKSMFLVLVVFVITYVERFVHEGVLGLDFLGEAAFYRVIATVLLLIVVIQTAIQIVRIIGGRTLINFVLGKYHRPVRENTIFMFLDLADSTALAERLGDVGVQTMITRFFFDITEPIIEHGGEIHRYVGDQVVVTWPLKAGDDNMDVIRCCFAIAELVEKKARAYERRFGTVPAYRIGLHGGPVVISQCGDQKQEISYFGDTVNTAARIEQQCKVLDCPLLISSELLDHISLPETLQCQRKGTVRLRGREQDTALFTIAAV